MKRIVFLTAVVAAAGTLATGTQARTHHRTAARWYHLSLSEKRTLVLRAIRKERSTLRWWLSSRPRFPQSASGRFYYCPAVGIHAPAVVCGDAARLVESIHVLRRIDAKIAAATRPRFPASLVAAFTCIHGFEGAWNANTGNGYYGGLQMDLGFQSSYGPEFLRSYGTADRWPIWAQLTAAIRAYSSGRGFSPWPSTARTCGLL